MLLLHGFGLDARLWAAQVRALQACHRVLVPDLPGFGPHGADVGRFSPAEELGRLLATKRVGPVHLVGSSLGGAVAVDFLLSHPNAVRTLVLVDALLLGEGPEIEGWDTCVQRAKRGDLDGAREAWLRSEAFGHVDDEPEARARVREMVDAYRGGHWGGMVETVWQRPAPRPLLEGVRCPTLVLVGEHDLESFQSMARSYGGTIPGARLEVLGGLGHLAPMEAPEHVNRLLLRFFEKTDGAPLQLPSSPRLTFRTWAPEDAGLAKRVWGDARVTSYILAEPFTPPQVQERLGQEIERQAKHGVQYGPVFLRATGELVGCCGLRPRASPPGTLELGFLLLPQHWGQGLATEAARATVRHAFDVLAAPALFAGHHPENAGSRRVLQKLGFKPTHVEHYPPTGLNHPCYQLSREDFQKAAPLAAGGI